MTARKTNLGRDDLLNSTEHTIYLSPWQQESLGSVIVSVGVLVRSGSFVVGELLHVLGDSLVHLLGEFRVFDALNFHCLQIWALVVWVSVCLDLP